MARPIRRTRCPKTVPLVKQVLGRLFCLSEPPSLSSPLATAMAANRIPCTLDRESQKAYLIRTLQARKIPEHAPHSYNMPASRIGTVAASIVVCPNLVVPHTTALYPESYCNSRFQILK